MTIADIDYRDWALSLKRKHEGEHRCSTCDGFGKVLVYAYGNDWEMQCRDCNGTGIHLMRAYNPPATKEKGNP